MRATKNFETESNAENYKSKTLIGTLVWYGSLRIKANWFEERCDPNSN